jgi:hypothetical protein
LGERDCDAGMQRRFHCPPGNPEASNLSKMVFCLHLINNSKNKKRALWGKWRNIS